MQWRTVFQWIQEICFYNYFTYPYKIQNLLFSGVDCVHIRSSENCIKTCSVRCTVKTQPGFTTMVGAGLISAYATYKWTYKSYKWTCKSYKWTYKPIGSYPIGSYPIGSYPIGSYRIGSYPPVASYRVL